MEFDMKKFKLTRKEEELAKGFSNKHLECAKTYPTTIGGYLTYLITPTGIAPIVSIKCNICGEENDITDYESW